MKLSSRTPKVGNSKNIQESLLREYNSNRTAGPGSTRNVPGMAMSYRSNVETELEEAQEELKK